MNNIRTGSKYFIVFIQMQYITPTHYTSPLLSKNESGGLHQGVTRVSSTLRIPSCLSKLNMKTFNLPLTLVAPLLQVKSPSNKYPLMCRDLSLLKVRYVLFQSWRAFLSSLSKEKKAKKCKNKKRNFFFKNEKSTLYLYEKFENSHQRHLQFTRVIV